MTNEHSKTVKQNFEQKAAEYDSFMQKCFPDYCELLDGISEAIPFKSNSELMICDLGSGTGNAAAILANAYPKAKIKCVDISPTMMDMAKAKLDNPAISYEVCDFYEYEFTEEYDVVVSSLALHHLVTDEDKKMFYARIYHALKPGGVFYNADIIIGSSDFIEEKFMQQWKNWLRQFHSESELMELVIDRYYEEDRPATLPNHLKWLHEVGFRNVDVILKKSKGAVFGGYK